MHQYRSWLHKLQTARRRSRAWDAAGGGQVMATPIVTSIIEQIFHSGDRPPVLHASSKERIEDQEEEEGEIESQELEP